MRIKYNAPAVLTFSLLCVLVLYLSQTILPKLIFWFMVQGRSTFNAGNFSHWISILTHTLGHGSWTHLISNMIFILVIGPMLEENYGSVSLFIMIIITALVTGVLNILFFPNPLMGASGVVFMMILLSSFTNFTRGEIPLTFIFVLILFMGEQIIRILSSENSNISYFAHIVGGLCGSFFGFFNTGLKNSSRRNGG
ncbi:MAG: rhomboid family intramembrane serine protease [Treponema sp.]|nr:rhomboid family intramembrane serine protease [Treponema sp.]